MRLDWVDRQDDTRYWVSKHASFPPFIYTTVTPSANLHPDCLSDEFYRINCRLPQTPRTPSTAAAHYFDDTFSRGNLRRRKSSVPTSPNTPGGDAARLRRSSTSRSIGNHSLYSPSSHADKAAAASSRRDSTATGDGDAFGNEEQLAKDRREEERRKSEADGHLEKYIGEQLSRIRTDEESVAVYEDEFEAQLD